MNEKNNIVKIGVAFCALYKDWVFHKENIIKSFHNLNDSFENECFFIICIQDYGNNTIDLDFGLKNCSVIYMQETGISLARNKCIDVAQTIDCKWLIFHDAAIYWPKNAARFIYTNRCSSIPPKLKLNFSDSIYNEVDNFDATKKYINPIYDTYIGAMLLSVDVIGSLRFDETHGPGSKTIFKSGEDVLFSFDYFARQGNFNVFEADELEIYHPPRSSDYEKHRIYARGQGRVFRVLLTKFFSLQLVIDSILFFGNAVFRCVLFKKNSFTILRERIVGFFDEV
jgi:hypothetical protein